MEDAYKQLQLDIYKNYQNILMPISGGADSTLLMYFLINYLQTYNKDAKIHFVTCAKEPIGFRNAIQSSIALNRVIELTDTELNFDHYTFYVKEQSREEFNNLERDWYSQGKIDISIWGTTQNPPYGIEGEPTESRAEYRDKGKFTRTLYFDNGRPTHVPFLKKDKRVVATLYKDYNLIESLLPYTRSCESHNRRITNNFTTHCGKCWWCWEKQWAFKSIGIE